MSVLNFPRIYFNGHMFWNPPTANNNDMFPLYDAVKMQMNWPFLKDYGITPENAASTLMPWTIAPIPKVPDYVLEVPGNYGAGGTPGEWNLFGDNGCGTVGYKDIQSLVIGGELQNNSYISQDDLVNKSYQLVGNPFGSTAQTPARFVDVSPWQNTFTALYFDKLIIGDSQCGLTLNRQHRMLDRFLNFNWAGIFRGLSYATTTWQTCFPKENLEWVTGSSVLLQTLKQQMEQQNAKGLMFRFSTYLTYYDKNGIFNDYPPFITHPTGDEDPAKILAEMQAMYQKGLDNVADIFFNPAYSRTAGTLGLWFEDEFPTAPAGRRLVPASPISVYKTTPGDTSPLVQLGVISAQVQPESNILSLDLGTGFPFYPKDKAAPVPVAEKFHAGDVQVGVRTNGQFSQVASFGFDQYQQSAFDKRSGILDLTLTPDAISKLQSGPLELQLPGSSPTTAATQQMWTAEVVESASFIDVGDTKTLNIMVQYDGKPAANAEVWVAEYNNAFSVTTSSYYLAFSNAADFTLFSNYPPTYEQNVSVLPQFLNTPPVLSLAADGSGRQLTEFLPPLTASVAKNDSPGEVTYQTYLSNPTALALTPCLSLANAIPQQGTLEGKNGSTVNYSVAKIKTDANGVAQLTFTAQAPGFPTLRFFVQEGEESPQVPFSFN